MKFKVSFYDQPAIIIDADGYWIARDGGLTLYQKSIADFDNLRNIQEFFNPVITLSVASFPKSEWKSVYQQEIVVTEQ